ncbi:hypothetical protein ACHAWX_003128 [Stephanocyclus meneghinianus]
MKFISTFFLTYVSLFFCGSLALDQDFHSFLREANEVNAVQTERTLQYDIPPTYDCPPKAGKPWWCWWCVSKLDLYDEIMDLYEDSPGKAFVALWGKPDGTVNYFSATGVETALRELGKTCGKESFKDAVCFTLGLQFTVSSKELSDLQKLKIAKAFVDFVLKQSASSVAILITKVILPTLGNSYNGIVAAAGAGRFKRNLVLQCSSEFPN